MKGYALRSNPRHRDMHRDIVPRHNVDEHFDLSHSPINRSPPPPFQLLIQFIISRELLFGRTLNSLFFSLRSSFVFSCKI